MNDNTRSESPGRAGTWADDLLRRCPPGHVDKVHRRLTYVLHPAAGGTADLIRDLNAARENLGQVNR